MEFRTDDLEDMRYGGVSDKEIVHREIIDHTRWSVVKRFVFTHGGRFWEWIVGDPATEQQDYGYAPEMTECPEVFEVPMVVTKYVKVEK